MPHLKRDARRPHQPRPFDADTTREIEPDPRGHLREKDGWLHRELLADESAGQLVPKLKASESDLGRAKTHLANGDMKAAAVYARSAFEWYSPPSDLCTQRGQWHFWLQASRRGLPA